MVGNDSACNAVTTITGRGVSTRLFSGRTPQRAPRATISVSGVVLSLINPFSAVGALGINFLSGHVRAPDTSGTAFFRAPF